MWKIRDVQRTNIIHFRVYRGATAKCVRCKTGRRARANVSSSRSTCDVNFPVPKTRRSDFLRLSGALLASHKPRADLIRAIYKRNVLWNDVQVVGWVGEGGKSVKAQKTLDCRRRKWFSRSLAIGKLACKDDLESELWVCIRCVMADVLNISPAEHSSETSHPQVLRSNPETPADMASIRFPC